MLQNWLDARATRRAADRRDRADRRRRPASVEPPAPPRRPSEWPHDPWDDPDVDRRAGRRAAAHAAHGRSRWSRTSALLLGVVAVLVGRRRRLVVHQQDQPRGRSGRRGQRSRSTPTTPSSRSASGCSDEGLITDAGVFRWYVDQQGGLELTPGYYQIRPSDHMGNVMRGARARRPSRPTRRSPSPRASPSTQMANRLAEKVPRMLGRRLHGRGRPTAIVALRVPARGRHQPRRAAVPRHVPGVERRVARPGRAADGVADGARRPPGADRREGLRAWAQRRTRC